MQATNRTTLEYIDELTEDIIPIMKWNIVLNILVTLYHPFLLMIYMFE